jgi:D-alanyl-D-alanine carboxypeptidase (penicillin-binding protein 5/6)
LRCHRTKSRRQRRKKDAPKKEAPKKDEPNISAPHAILIDGQYGGVLFDRDADRLIFPASLAKLMTAEYVFHEIKEGRIKLTTNTW